MNDAINRQMLALWNRYKPTIAVDAIEYDRELRQLLGTNLAEVGTDLISRRAAIDALKNRKTAKQSSAGIMRNAVIDFCVEIIKELPSAQPRGKWIYHIDDLFPAESTMECSQCHAEQPLTCDDEFCPHCGAKMEVTE